MGNFNFKGTHTRTKSHKILHVMGFKGIWINECTRPTMHQSQQSQLINTVVLRSYLKEVFLSSPTIFLLSTLNETLGYSSLTKIDFPPIDWDLEEMFSSWNITVWASEDWIQVTGNHRATMILDKVYKALFHCEDFLYWAYKPNLPGTFLLALKVEFEKVLHLHNESYDTDVNYNLPQPFKKTACIYVVASVAETSFGPMGKKVVCNTHLPIYPDRKASRAPTSSNGPQMS